MVHAKTKNGKTPFHSACIEGQTKLFNIFMENVADLRIDLNTKDNCGSTAFHDACGLSHANVVKIIMENAAALSIDLNIEGEQKKSTQTFLSLEAIS